MEEKISGSTVIVAAKDQLSCDLLGEVAVYSLKSDEYFVLNSVGAAIWNLVQEPRSLEDLRSILLDRYAVDAEECRQDLLEWTEKLAAAGVIEVPHRAAVSR